MSYDAARIARLEAQALRRRLRVTEAERDDARARLRAFLVARVALLPSHLQSRAPAGEDVERLLAFAAGVDLAGRVP